MKLLFILPLFIYICLYSYGQNVTFTKEINGIKHTHTNTILKAPFDLVFNSAFKDDVVEISNDSGLKLESKFGNGTLNPNGRLDPTYSIKVIVNPDDTTRLMIFPFKENFPVKGLLIIKINNVIIDTLKYQYTFTPTENEKAYQPGLIYYDAMALASKDNSIAVNTKLKILEAYGYKGDSSNPYLKPLFDSLKLQSTAQTTLSPLSLISSVGSADVTNFAAGLARFLAERAKEELNEAFFNKMDEQLNAYPELTTAFPQTSNILKTIENYSYSSVLQVLKEAFETDIQNLPENIYKIKELDPSKCSSLDACSCDDNQNCKQNNKCKRGCEKCKCEIRLGNIQAFFKTINGQWVGVGMFTVKEAIQSTNPADLIKTICESDELTAVKESSEKSSNFGSYNLVSTIELGNFISQSLLSKDEGQVWINSSEFNALFKTKGAFQIYVGLLLAKQNLLKKEKKEIIFYKSKSINDTIYLRTVLVNAFKQQEELKNLVKTTFMGFNSANNAVKKMIEASSKSIEAEPQALYDYYKVFTSSLKQVATNSFIEKVTGKEAKAEFERIAQFLDPAVDMAYHISTKKYSSAIYDAVVLLNNIKIPDFDQNVIKPFIKYGTLISTVASAQSSDEVKKAIEASVLPAGSSAVKRKSAWSISVNAYVGLYYGWAHSKSIDTSFNSSTNTLDTITRSTVNGTYGLYAPIGLSFNRGFKCGHKKYWGITLSTQLLDVGALVNFYATNGDGASLPTDFKVRLSDILSPGLQLGVNLPGPITVMGGFQYVPALNNVSQVASSSTLSPIAWRVQVGIVVDIPLYHLKVWDFRK